VEILLISAHISVRSREHEVEKDELGPVLAHPLPEGPYLSHLNTGRNRMDTIHEIEMRTVKESIRKRAPGAKESVR